MAEEIVADMEVLAKVTDKTTDTKTVKKTRGKAKAVVLEEPPVDPDPPTNPDPDPEPEPGPDPEPEPESPELPVYMNVSFIVMDRVIEEVKSGKSIKEAISFDSRLSSAFADHPFLVVRESRNGYCYALRADLPLVVGTTPSSIGTTPVSYALPK